MAHPSQPPVAGETLAARAERFRNGAPFLVERATLYDPDPLDLPVAPADPRLRAPRTLLPAALTLLGIVIVVGLAAGILFVRNADGPRTDEAQNKGKDRETGRLGQFSERVVPRPPPAAPAPAAPTRRDQVTYDLTRRSHDTIVGAWRSTGDVRPQHAEEAKPAPPAVAPEAAPNVVSTPSDPPPKGFRRLLPRRFTSRPGKPAAEPVAELATPPRAPLDEPHIPKATADVRPAERVRAPLDEPHVPKASIEADRAAPAPARRQAAAEATERPGGNVVARVGRATDPKERHKSEADKDAAPPIEAADTDKRMTTRERYAANRARRAELRRQRQARRRAIDLDRFLVREKGDVPYGFVFSGPQAQRP